jgi:5-methylcytosine-specific restriction endonuclease McrA
MDIELETITKQMNGEITIIRDKYNKLKKEIRQKYKKLENQSNPKPKRITIPKTVKDTLWDDTFSSNAGEGKCYVCSNVINSKKFDCGHIIAVANGGTNDISNLKPICSTCNKSMGTKNLEEFKQDHFSNKGTIKSFNGSNLNNFNGLNPQHGGGIGGMNNNQQYNNLFGIKKQNYHNKGFPW